MSNFKFNHTYFCIHTTEGVIHRRFRLCVNIFLEPAKYIIFVI